jgi:hypothetical protein
LTPSTPALPPDVSTDLKSRSHLKLDSITSGFAAGCEYRLEEQEPPET